MIRIKTTAFSDLKPADLVSSAQTNVNQVSSNPEFAGITPLPAVVQSVVSDLSAKIALAQNGSKIQKNERDLAKSILVSYLTQWSNFVAMKANAKSTEQQQVATVKAAAFVPAAHGNRVGDLEAVTDIRTKSLSRSVSISWRSVSGADLYQVMKAPGYANGSTAWTECAIVSRVRITIPCNPAEIVSFIIYPLGTSGRGPQSRIVTCLAGL